MKRKVRNSVFFLIMFVVVNMTITAAFGYPMKINASDNVNNTLSLHEKSSLPKAAEEDIASYSIKGNSSANIQLLSQKNENAGNKQEIKSLQLQSGSIYWAADKHAKAQTFDMNKLSKSDRIVFTKAIKILSEIIKPDMSELEKEYTIFDYVITNVKYDFGTYLDNYTSSKGKPFSMYGALVQNKAVCSGITEGIDLLFKMVGIESYIVTGGALGNRGYEGHDWNIVKINGQYYHVDATWSLSDDKNTYYGFFNLNTKEIQASGHTFVVSDYPKCNSKQFAWLHEPGHNTERYRDGIWMYYVLSGQEDKADGLYKEKINGENETLIIEGSLRLLYMVGKDFICIDDDSSNLFRIKNDGTDREVLKEDVYNNVRLYNNYVIYQTGFNSGFCNIYLNNLTFDDEKLIGTNAFTNYDGGGYLKEPYFIYNQYNDENLSESKLMSLNLKDISKTELFNCITYCNWLYDDKYCYVVSGNQIYKVSLDGKEKKVLVDETKSKDFIIDDTSMLLDDEYLFYSLIRKGKETVLFPDESDIKYYRVSLVTGKISLDDFYN